MIAGDYSFIHVERRGRVGLIRLDRPKALNAINRGMARELAQVIPQMEKDAGVGCILVMGQNGVFCAGADIKEAMPEAYPATLTENYLAELDVVAKARKPMVAAVSGVALGGGCELAMMCDIVIADDTARFALPEIRLGVMPGAGGTQRMAQTLGKACTMDLCLTGRALLADEAARLGLVSRIVSSADLEEQALATATAIAQVSLPASMSIKEAVLAAFDGLEQGLRLERRLFHALYATEDRKEGMRAFVEKRAPDFHHR